MAFRSPLINVMASAATKAARGLKRDFGEVENLQVSKKGPSDFVSVADQKAEDVLYAELARVRPDFGFLMEERGIVEGSDKSHRWIIDPLDGTTNFLHGLPHFAISIGCERDGEVIAGVVYNPITDEMYWAEKGAGAYCNDRRLRVAVRKDLKECVIATGIPFHGRGDHMRFLKELGLVMREVAGVRRFGSAALDLAFVAAGRFDGFWETGLQSWDIAAGIILVREAGGFVTDVRGAKKVLEAPEIIAGNEIVHEKLRRLVERAGLGPKRVKPRKDAAEGEKEAE
ncbi:inositol monophosphatase family protein [Zavarzinia sp.]|uniref:inositol monophosphatase family protein n=1 Tax=Zavarzinia sp. TaxID=2027920 RepID=UPI0035692862